MKLIMTAGRAHGLNMTFGRQIIIAACLALAASQGYVPDSDKYATIIVNTYEQALDNSYRQDTETSNGISISSTGVSLPGPDPETGSTRMQGSYSYTAPDGTPITVNWVADELGYRAESDVIPVAPQL